MQSLSYPNREALTCRAFYYKTQTARPIARVIQAHIPPTPQGIDGFTKVHMLST